MHHIIMLNKNLNFILIAGRIKKAYKAYKTKCEIFFFKS